METLVFEPLLPPPLLAACWTLALAACLAYAFWRPTRLPWTRRASLAALHFIPFTLALLILHRPTWVRIAGDDGGRPVLTVLVDASASMATPDAGENRARLAAAIQQIERHRETWSRDFDVRIQPFDATLTVPLDAKPLTAIEPAGAATDIAASVESLASGPTKPSMALMFSDGIHNAPESSLANAARLARAAGLPVFTLPLGTAVGVRDIGLSLAASEELAFVNQRVKIPVAITQTGFDNHELAVELRHAGTAIDKKTIRFTAGATETTVEFETSRDTAGLYTFDVAIPPQPGEALSANNRRRFALRVVNDRIRILLLEGKPYWDSKFLSRVLRRDPNVLLTTATLLRNDRVVIDPPALETGAATVREAWSGPRDPRQPLEDRRFLVQYQVVVLGRDADAFFSEPAIENIRDWISRSGGHLICARGRPMNESALTPAIAGVLPVAWKSGDEKRFGMKLTERGRSLALFEAGAGAAPQNDPDVLLKSLPTLVTATTVERERSLTVVLARAQSESGGEPMAVLSVQRYGTGKSVVLEGQGLWRWGFRPPNDPSKGEEIFRAFWANMVRWLAGSSEFLPSQEVALRPGKPIYQAGERPLLYVLRREPESVASSASMRTAMAASAAPAVVEIIRENDSGAADPTFATVRDTAQPVPNEPLMGRVEFGALPEGHYRARIVGATPPAESAFDVLPPVKEKLDLRARPAVLEELSRATDARIVGENDLADLASLYREFVRRHRPGNEIKRPAWDRPWMLGLFFGSLAATWWLRRRWGAI